jgi:hypothetical protein
VEITGLTGDALPVVLATLANPHRLRIVATLIRPTGVWVHPRMTGFTPCGNGG